MAQLSARPSNGAARIEVPLRALIMRTILLELERICNHVADIGAIATDVGFVIANAHASRLKEMLVTVERAVDWKSPVARHGLRRRGTQGLGRGTTGRAAHQRGLLCCANFRI